jgi:virulence-associated protein VapD
MNIQEMKTAVRNSTKELGDEITEFLKQKGFTNVNVGFHVYMTERGIDKDQGTLEIIAHHGFESDP